MSPLEAQALVAIGQARGVIAVVRMSLTAPEQRGLQEVLYRAEREIEAALHALTQPRGRS